MSDNTKKKLPEWYVIVNPNAGRRKGEKDWKEIRSLLKNNGFDFESIFTEHRNHAKKITDKAIIEGYRNFIVVGGDGTMNEVVNGILCQKEVPSTDITIGMIQVGTGNDWGRMYQVSKDYTRAVNTLKAGKTFIQDAGEVKYQNGDGEKTRYFVNIAGLGFDALIASKTNKMKEKGGGAPAMYLVNLLLGLFQYKALDYELFIDGKEVFSGKVFSMSVGICKYNGGGMMQLPFAEPDNGLFDITVIRKTSKIKIASKIASLYDGSFVKIPEVQTYRGKKIRITSNPPKSVYLETDGESLGHSPLAFSIIPKSIKLIAGEKFFESRES